MQENICKCGTSSSFTCASQRQDPFRIFLRVARVDLALDAVRIERGRRLAGAAGTAVPATSVTPFCFTPHRTRLADLTDVQLRLRRVLLSAWRPFRRRRARHGARHGTRCSRTTPAGRRMITCSADYLGELVLLELAAIHGLHPETELGFCFILQSLGRFRGR